MFATPSFSFKLVLSLCAVSIAIRTLELLVKIRIFGENGCLSWQLMQELNPSGRVTWLKPLLVSRGFFLVLMARLAAALGLLLFSQRYLLLPCLIVLVLSSALFILRIPVGQDGSDQMNILILIPALLALLCRGEQAKVVVMVFVAAQVSLAYTTSGLAKVVSPVWRSGSAIPGILSTFSFGNSSAAQVFRLSPTWGWIASWSVMVFETFFFVWILAGPGGSLLILAVGIGFHVACAVMMGLNCFLWSFLATYPAILFCSLQLAALAKTECPAIPQPFDPIFPATTLHVLLFSFLAGISPVFGSETMKIKLVLFGIRFSS